MAPCAAESLNGCTALVGQLLVHDFGQEVCLDVMQMPGGQRLVREAWSLPPDLKTGRQMGQRTIADAQPIDARRLLEERAGSDLGRIGFAAALQ